MTTVIICDNNGVSKETHSCVITPALKLLTTTDSQIPRSVLSWCSREALWIVLQQVAISVTPVHDDWKWTQQQRHVLVFVNLSVWGQKMKTFSCTYVTNISNFFDGSLELTYWFKASALPKILEIYACDELSLVYIRWERATKVIIHSLIFVQLAVKTVEIADQIISDKSWVCDIFYFI